MPNPRSSARRVSDDQDLGRYAAELELDVELFDSGRTSAAVLRRVGRDVASAWLRVR